MQPKAPASWSGTGQKRRPDGRAGEEVRVTLMDKGQRVTEQEIETSLSILARLIDRYGDAYWPIFERLERELTTRQERRTRLSVHLRTSRHNKKQTFGL